MNTRRKGRLNENKACTILEKQGFICNMPNPKHQRQKDNGRTGYTDFFSLWDIIAVRHDTVRFIQVKSNKKVYGKALLPYVAFRCPLNCSREIWTFYDRVKEPEIKYL